MKKQPNVAKPNTDPVWQIRWKSKDLGDRYTTIFVAVDASGNISSKTVLFPKLCGRPFGLILNQMRAEDSEISVKSVMNGDSEE